MANVSNIRPFIQKWEGGLSKNPSDSASLNPAPCSYNGITGYHTNKGVTYTTFKNLATKLNYNADCDTFFKMPDDVWDKIFYYGYWQPASLDNCNSQAIADALSNWSWGSGVNGAFNILKNYLATRGIKVLNWTQAINEINKISAFNETETFLQLISWREQFFKSLNQPTFLNGWLNRLEDMKQYGLNTIKKKSI